MPAGDRPVLDYVSRIVSVCRVALHPAVVGFERLTLWIGYFAFVSAGSSIASGGVALRPRFFWPDFRFLGRKCC